MTGATPVWSDRPLRHITVWERREVMEAVIATGGKQYRVAPGQVISVEKLAGEPGAAVDQTNSPGCAAIHSVACRRWPQT